MSQRDFAYLHLTDQEVERIMTALQSVDPATPHHAAAIGWLISRLKCAVSPEITVGVYGGVVQWIRGNPFPIRIIDYDGNNDDLIDRDDEGLPCSLSYVGPDPDLAMAQSRDALSR